MQKQVEEKQFWDKVRKEFPLAPLYFRNPKVGFVYFSDASIGIPPIFSYTAAQIEDARCRNEWQKLRETFNRQSELVEDARHQVAKLFSTNPQNIIFENSTTAAMRLVGGMVLKEGDEVIATSAEYPPSMRVFIDPNYKIPPEENLHPHRVIKKKDGSLMLAEYTGSPDALDKVGLTFQNYAVRSGDIRYGSAFLVQMGERTFLDIKIKTVDVGKNDEETLANIENAIGDKTRLVVVSHVLRTNGRILPIKKISEIIQKHSSEKPIYLLVDGAQATGNLHPDQTKLDELGCNFYTTCSHKMLLAVAASGILYVRPEDKGLVQNLVEDNPYYRGIPFLDFKAFQFPHDNSPLTKPTEFGSKKIPSRTVDDWIGLDDRTLWEFMRISTPEIESLRESLGFLIQKIGWDRLHSRLLELKKYAEGQLGNVPHIKFHSPEEENASPAILTFSLEGRNSIDVVEKLREKGIETTWIVKPDSIRLSFSARNNERDIEMLARALREIASAEPPILK